MNFFWKVCLFLLSTTLLLWAGESHVILKETEDSGGSGFGSEEDQKSIYSHEDSNESTSSASTEDFGVHCPLHGVIEGNDYGEINSRLTYALDPITKGCYPVSGPNRTEPCEENMSFYVRPDDNRFGFCDCSNHVDTVYSNTTGKCHKIYEQEYCVEGEWLVSDANGTMECQTNPCLDLPYNEDEGNAQKVLYFEGKCVKIGDLCGYSGGIVLDQFEPKCKEAHENIRDGKFVPAHQSIGGGLAVPVLTCSPGTRWSSITESCKAAIEFSFD